MLPDSWLQMPDGTEVRLSLSFEKDPQSGECYIRRDVSYIGSISPDGKSISLPNGLYHVSDLIDIINQSNLMMDFDTIRY